MDYRKMALKDEEAQKVDYDKLPEQRGGGQPNINPGTYIFELPANVAEAWEIRETTRGQRVAIKSDRDHPIVVAGVVREDDKPLIGEVWYGSVSTAERNRAKKGEPEALVSDMTYLLRDGLEDKEAKPQKSREFMQAVSKHAGARFMADNTWSAFCNKAKPRYIEVDGQVVEDPDKTPGCGENYYMRDIPRDAEGYYMERFTCKKCGASLRAFQNLERFRPAPKTESK